MLAQMSSSVDISKSEASRYALIRRLSFVFRHHLVVNLQPLSMIYQVMHHRLNATPVDVSAMHDCVDQANRLVRTSIDSCMDVVSWLTAESDATVNAALGVKQCLGNVRSNLSFRGFVIQYEEPSLDMHINQCALREVLTAALLAATDHAEGMTDISLSMLAVPNAVGITLQLQRGDGESSPQHGAYRLIGWDDVQILAELHGVDFSHRSNELVKIRIAQSPETRSETSS
ncbi:MAG: hypothetical protein V4858_13880 [Pseudomonadota bacterium]